MNTIRDVREDTKYKTRRAVSRRYITASALIAIALMAGSSLVFAGTLDKVVSFNIKAQSLEKALVQFGVQAHVQIVFASKTAIGQTLTTALKGRYTGRQALTYLLRGSKLSFVDDGATAEILPKAPAQTDQRHRVTEQADPVESNAVTPHRHIDPKTPVGNSKKKDVVARHGPQALQQVIVTGTHLSGGTPPSTPLISITRLQIQQSGYQTVEQVMDSLPENFASVGSEASGIFLASDINAGNIANGAAVDLMGLGVDSTLVLVNGHRLAPSGSSGAFTDVSVIPLSAIKRIDIMTDGASAIYGADAIGGVVNYILRSHEPGAETSVEYGAVTRGGLKDYRASQSAGLNWSSGNAFLAYEFRKQTPLLAADRSFSESAGQADLLAGTTQNSLYASATNLVGNETLEGDAFISARTGAYSAANFTGPPINVGTRSTQYSVGVGSSIQISESSSAKIRLGYGGNDTHLSDIYGLYAAQSTLLTLSGSVSGIAARLPSGPIKFAFGGQLRRVHFARHFGGAYASGLAAINQNRVVGSIFAETSIPLLPAGDRVSGKQPLALDLAARYEHYSDFGASLNPRAGLAWQPLRALRVRATVSTSFKPPNFYELYGEQVAVLENAVSSGSPSGVAPILELEGSNPNLKSERATEWTAGVDITPESVRSLNIHATYFHIRFRNRITSPNVPYVDVFSSGGLYKPFIRTNPSLAELDSLTQAPTQYFNDTIYPGYGPPAGLPDARAILNNLLQNIGLTRVSGVNDTVSYAAAFLGFRCHAAVNTVYLFHYQNVAIPGAVPIEVLSTLEHPVNFKGRLTVGFDKRGWSVNGALNYVNHYSDPSGSVPVRIAPWTTVDLQVSYRVPKVHMLTNGLQVALSCANCLDRAPPTVRTTSFLFGYDPTNASPMGRFLSLTVRKQW